MTEQSKKKKKIEYRAFSNSIGTRDCQKRIEKIVEIRRQWGRNFVDASHRQSKKFDAVERDE